MTSPTSSSHYSNHDHHPPLRPIPRVTNAIKQLKFVALGGLSTYYLDTYSELVGLVFPGWVEGATAQSRTARITAPIALALLIMTVTLFLYLVLLPRVKGIHPEFGRWRDTQQLRTIVPILTFCILSGWTLLVYSLAKGTNLGLPKSVVGAIGLYTLAFGLIGLIPVPDRVIKQM